MNIQLGDYSIRSFRRNDTHALTVHANSYLVSKYLRDSFPHPYSSADADAWIRFVHAQEEETNFAITEADSVVGGIGIRLCPDVHRVGGEVGYWLGESFWGKGVGTRALKAFTTFAFPEYGLERIWAGVFEKNTASVRVLEKSGYLYEGTHRRAVIKEGEVMDELIYAALATDWE